VASHYFGTRQSSSLPVNHLPQGPILLEAAGFLQKNGGNSKRNLTTECGIFDYSEHLSKGTDLNTRSRLDAQIRGRLRIPLRR